MIRLFSFCMSGKLRLWYNIYLFVLSVYYTETHFVYSFFLVSVITVTFQQSFYSMFEKETKSISTICAYITHNKTTTTSVSCKQYFILYYDKHVCCYCSLDNYPTDQHLHVQYVIYLILIVMG